MAEKDSGWAWGCIIVPGGKVWRIKVVAVIG